MITNEKLLQLKDRQMLQSGDVLSCSGTSWLARAIKKMTKSRINHTALVLEIWGELFIMDSQKDGTNPRRFEEWTEKYKYEYRVHRPMSFSKEQKKKAISKSGTTPYDFSSLLWYQPRYLFTGKWKGKKGKKAEDRMYCSEYVSWVFNFEDWWANSPQRVLEILESSDDFKEINFDYED